MSRELYEPMARRAAIDAGIDPDMFVRLVEQESSWNPRNVNPRTRAMGLTQVMPATAKDPGYKVPPLADPWDPQQNLNFGARYYRAMLDARKGNEHEALAAYNWGLGNVQKRGMHRMPKETRDYIQTISQRRPGTPAAAATPVVTPVSATVDDTEARTPMRYPMSESMGPDPIDVELTRFQGPNKTPPADVPTDGDSWGPGGFGRLMSAAGSQSTRHGIAAALLHMGAMMSAMGRGRAVDPSVGLRALSGFQSRAQASGNQNATIQYIAKLAAQGDPRAQRWLGAVQANPALAAKAMEDLMSPVKGVVVDGELRNPYTNELIGGGERDPNAPIVLDKDQRAAVGMMAGRYDKRLKEYRLVRDGWNKINELAHQNSGIADFSMIVAYAKILDPGTAAREGEVNAVLNNVTDWVTQYGMDAEFLLSRGRKGRLKPEIRKQILSAARPEYIAKLKEAHRLESAIKRNAAMFGVPAETILWDPAPGLETVGTAEEWDRNITQSLSEAQGGGSAAAVDPQVAANLAAAEAALQRKMRAAQQVPGPGGGPMP